jgi:hypothetical protein
MSNATFNNISAISWWSVLLVEETRVPGENQRPAASHWQTLSHTVVSDTPRHAQALVSFKKYMPPPLPYFKVNICPVPLPHLALIFFAYLWSFRWPNYIVTLPRYFSFRLPHLNIPTGPPSDELDKNIQRTSLGLLFSHWNGYSHFRSSLNWFRK